MANTEEKKPSYTKCAFRTDRNAPSLENTVAMIEGFTKDLRIRTVSVNGENRKVADLILSAIINDKSVEKYFGKEFVNSEYHSVRFRISYWGLAADNIEKYPPQINQKMICLVDRMKVRKDEYEGRTYFSVDANGCDWPHSNSARKEGAVSALNQGKGAAAPAAASGSVNTSNDFAELELDDEGELPF